MKFMLILAGILLAACQEEPAPSGLEGQPFNNARTIAVGDAPHGMQKKGDRLYIAAAGDDQIEVLDLKSFEIVERWPAPDTPLDIIESDMGWLVSAFRSDYLHYLGEGGEATTMSWPVGSGPSLFAPDRGGDLVYIVSEFDNTFTIFDRKIGKVSAVYETGARPYPADVTRDGVLAFIPNREDNSVSVIDLLNQEEVTRVAVCAGPLGGALTGDDVTYIVTCGDADKVAFINTASLTVTAEAGEGIGPRPFSVVTSPDGRFAFVNNSAGTTLSVIDLATKKVVQNMEVGETPIVVRVFENTLYVASEGSNTVSIIPLGGRITTLGGPNNEVIVLGMIHDGFNTSERYSSDILREVIRRIDPDIVIAEIPPNRLDAALDGFRETGQVSERRTRVFPEYTDVLFPLTREMDFEIIGGAAWNTYMNSYRSRALGRIADDPARAAEWQAHQDAKRVQRDAIGGRWDDPIFIHSDGYDAIQKAGYTPYNSYFNDDLGPGGWDNINAGHYALIEKVLDKYMFKGKRILITFGASHKYWFLEKLRERDDIRLIDPLEFFEKD